MTATRTTRYCRCGAQLARDNRGSRCAACAAADRNRLAVPSDVPPEFWEEPVLQEALLSRHMGRVVRAWRTHPDHGRNPVPQDQMAAWLGITQAQLSRIENGPPMVHLDRLIHWAHVLRIPTERLWFAMPDATWPFGDDAAGRPATVQVISQQEVQPETRTHSTSLHEEIVMSAEELARFVRRAGVAVNPEVLEQLDTDVKWLAVEYLRRPPYAIFRPLAALRRDVFDMIDRHPRPGHLADLYSVAGQLSALLAHASNDLASRMPLTATPGRHGSVLTSRATTSRAPISAGCNPTSRIGAASTATLLNWLGAVNALRARSATSCGCQVKKRRRPRARGRRGTSSRRVLFRAR
jgi:transcriptional regulator with XRE-family HTH domain